MGYKREEVIGQWFGSFLHTSYVEEYREHFRNFIERGYTRETFLILRKKSGENIHVSFEGTVGYDKDGKEKCTYCTFKDVSETKAFERELILKNKALENSLNGFILMDESLNIIYVNRALSSLFGYGSVNEIIGKHSFEILGENQEIKDLFKAINQNGKADEFFRVKHNDGSMMDIRLLGVFFTDDENRQMYLATLLDMTEKLKNQKLLEQSEEKYRLLVENQTDLIVKMDQQGKFLFVSQSYCRTFGTTESKLLGTAFMPMVHEEDKESTAVAMEKLNEPPYTCYLEQRVLTARGWRWFSWVDKALLDEQGNIHEILGLGRDITDRKLAEETLLNSENRYQRISSLSSDYSYSLLINEDGTIEPEWNFGSFERITGYDPNDIWRNGNIIDCFFPEDRPKMKERTRKIFQGEIVTTEARFICKSGEIKWIRDRGFPEWNKEKTRVIRTIGAAQDITEQKRYEEKIQLRNLELNKTMEELTIAQEELVQQERLAAMGQFSAGIAHDFNNILTGVLGTAEILNLDNSLTQAQRDHIKTIRQSGERAADLVQKIMDYSRKSIRKVKKLNLKECISDSLNIIRSGITENYNS
jgi:PAS domain S-box-containing protein